MSFYDEYASGLGEEQFAYLAKNLHEQTGIVLPPRKRSMVHSRLIRRLRALKIHSYDEYIRFIDSPEGELEMPRMVNAITTNMTRFFRELHHFDHMLKISLPQCIAAAKHSSNQPRLRIWSAGCSSGEEPYSIAMTMRAAIPGIAKWDAKVLATDLDSDMVNHGRCGQYLMDQNFDSSDFPPGYIEKYTGVIHHGDQTILSINNAIRNMVTFNHLNLLHDWPMRGKFDIIFCRNVVIYFDKETQKKLFDRLADSLVDGGWLYIGHSENLFNLSTRFSLKGKTIYQKI